MRLLRRSFFTPRNDENCCVIATPRVIGGEAMLQIYTKLWKFSMGTALVKRGLRHAMPIHLTIIHSSFEIHYSLFTIFNPYTLYPYPPVFPSHLISKIRRLYKK